MSEGNCLGMVQELSGHFTVRTEENHEKLLIY